MIFFEGLIARVEEGLEKKKKEEKRKKIVGAPWNVYVWNDAPRAVKDEFSEALINRTDDKRCLFALHYVTLHYITFNYITLHYMLPV